MICFAGLAAYWKDPKTGEALRSCAILTAQAEGALAGIHDRTPVVLPGEAYAAWLHRKIVDPVNVRALAAKRLPPSAFAQWKVRLLVNNAKSDGPELIEPLAAEDSTSAG
jgi:putative SOS response-associated peptidase YedK